SIIPLVRRDLTVDVEFSGIIRRVFDFPKLFHRLSPPYRHLLSFPLSFVDRRQIPAHVEPVTTFQRGYFVKGTTFIGGEPARADTLEIKLPAGFDVPA